MLPPSKIDANTPSSKLPQEQHTNGHLYVAVSILSAGVIVALVVGAAVGSQAKEHHES